MWLTTQLREGEAGEDVHDDSRTGTQSAAAVAVLTRIRSHPQVLSCPMDDVIATNVQGV